MKASEKLQALEQQALSFSKRWLPRKQLTAPDAAAGGSSEGAYPHDFIDIIVFHRLHLGLSVEKALKSYRTLKDEFVDWNEVRISSVREVQEAMGFCAGSLELAVFIKDILDLLHRERRDVSLEFLAEKNLGEIRQYLKRFRGIDPSTIELVLRLRKEHPVVPLNHAMELVLSRLGLFRKGDNRGKFEKELYAALDPERALLLHHFLVNHSVERCPPDETALGCASCSMRHACAFYARKGKKKPAASAVAVKAPAHRKASSPKHTPKPSRKPAATTARSSRTVKKVSR